MENPTMAIISEDEEVWEAVSEAVKGPGREQGSGQNPSDEAADLVLGKRHAYGGEAPGILREAQRLGVSQSEIEAVRKVYDFKFRARMKTMEQPKL